MKVAGLLAALLLLASFAFPLSDGASLRVVSDWHDVAGTLLAAGLFVLAGWARPLVAVPLGLVGVVLGCAETLGLLGSRDIHGHAAWGYWLLVLGTWVGAAVCVTRLANLQGWIVDWLVPAIFGLFVIYLWEVAVRGFGVPSVLMPAPSSIVVKLADSLPVLGEDFVQTILRGVLVGYVLGCGAGIAVAVLAHRFTFLGRGLLPLGNFISALPIVGIAPIMVMWFGFDWPSKAAVVAVITFFPMLVNALAGLAAAGAIERDLMRSYGSTYMQTLGRLHLPAALPFIFNALKINSTLALIGAIVAEFFGTPTRGIGFRISIEIARMSLDMVWAEITLAAVAGMAFYGLVALAERATTFWHPSYRD
jgi:NitT/TauT family transport system permease protein